MLSEGYPKPSEAEAPAPTTLASLVHLKVWCGWRPETQNGRTTKVPYDTRNGRHASSTNPSTWTTHDEAQKWATSGGAGAGVGLMFTRIGDLFTCGVDLEAAATQIQATSLRGRRRCSTASQPTRKYLPARGA